MNGIRIAIALCVCALSRMRLSTYHRQLCAMVRRSCSKNDLIQADTHRAFAAYGIRHL